MPSPNRWVFSIGLMTFAALAVSTRHTEGTISGIVVGPGEQPIAGVLVSSRLHNSIRRTTVVSDGQGQFHFPRLLPGTYLISGTAAGFDVHQIEDVTVADAEVSLTLRASRSDDPMAGATSSDYLEALPYGEEKRRFILDCTGCHQFDAGTVMAADGLRVKTAAEWRRWTDQMLQNFGPQSAFPIISQYRDAEATAVRTSGFAAPH